ncbi:MAG: stage III sporulation protein AG [Clostridium sp.]|nr:stage III sporulation protein AG [Clostridium sp.]
MDKEKIKKEIKDAFKNNKNINNILAVILVLIFILIAINVFLPNGDKADKKDATNASTTANSNEKAIVDSSKSNENSSSYEEAQKKSLISILKKIKGVGNVDCMITFEGGEVKVPAYDENTQNNTTEETDKEGGKRVSNQKSDGSKVVMSTNKGDNEPFILETRKPKVVGVMVVAEGAKDSKVKSSIEKAVINLYDIPANKVNVFSMD